MTSIKISNQLQVDTTTVSNRFIDCYMPEASGDFVKIYLYVLRAAGSGLSPTISDIADALSAFDNDVMRGLRYWESQGLLELHFSDAGELEFLQLLPVPSDEEGEQREAETPALPIHKHNEDSLTQRPPLRVVAPVKKDYDPEIVTKTFSQPGLDSIQYMASVLIGHMLSPEEMSTLYYIHHDLGFSGDLLTHLIEYCADQGKAAIRYIESVAINWHSHGITTRQQAEEYCNSHSKAISQIKKALGLTTWGSAANTCLRTWQDVYHFSLDMILEACNRAYKTTGGSNALNYADGILKRWNKDGIRTPEDVKTSDKNHRTSAYKNRSVPKKATTFDNFSHQQIDYDAIIDGTYSYTASKKGK